MDAARVVLIKETRDKDHIKDVCLVCFGTVI